MLIDSEKLRTFIEENIQKYDQDASVAMGQGGTGGISIGMHLNGISTGLHLVKTYLDIQEEGQ